MVDKTIVNEKDLQLDSYDYHLPVDLIAQRPLFDRPKCRLLVYEKRTNKLTHTYFDQIEKFLPKKTLLVMNNSKVFPARIKAQKIPSLGRAEFLMLSLTAESDLYPCMIRSNHKKKIGDEFQLSTSQIVATIQKVEMDGQFRVSFNISEKELRDFFFREGLIPIPPYIRQGESDNQDKNDYQTVFAGDEDKQLGSVAAPTAGLHFDQQLLQSLKEKGHERAFVTLHVGLGTFLPVKNESILQHEMHEEAYFIDDNNLTKIQKAYEEKQNVIAVGTTSLRVLESSYSLQKKKIELSANSIMNKTKIFLHPGKNVNSINGLITNFHLPKSTLLMLVSSLIGREKTLELYQVAIDEKYRFFSYGDAMLILLS